MTESYQCPADLETGEGDCGRTFSTENGAVMHGLNKSDGYHDCITTKVEGYKALAKQSPESSDSGLDTESPTSVSDGGETNTFEAAMPDASESAGDGHADCPECGESLGVSEAEASAFIAQNGEAWCDECGTRLVADGVPA